MRDVLNFQRAGCVISDGQTQHLIFHLLAHWLVSCCGQLLQASHDDRQGLGGNP